MTLAPCCRCDSTHIKGSYRIRPGQISYRVFCEDCQLSTSETFSRDMREAKERAESFWNCTLPRLRLKSVSRTLDSVIKEVMDSKSLDRQLQLFG